MLASHGSTGFAILPMAVPRAQRSEGRKAMLFCSQRFLLFFLIVFTMYWCLPWHWARIGVLLGASFWFYASWNKWLALLVGTSAVLDYFIGLGLDSSRSHRQRRASWTLVVWGAIHGILLIVHRAFRGLRRGKAGLECRLQSAPGTALHVALTLTAVSVTWVFFLAPSRAASSRMLQGLFPAQAGLGPPVPLQSFWILASLVLVAHALPQRVPLARSLARLPAPILGFGYALALTLALDPMRPGRLSISSSDGDPVTGFRSRGKG
jgi:hypothetical protein